MKRSICCKIACLLLALNLLLILFTAFVLFDSLSVDNTNVHGPIPTTTTAATFSVIPLNRSTENQHVTHDDDSVRHRSHWTGDYVEVWSKAAMGQYVWENILRGNIDLDQRHQHHHHSQQSLYIEGSTNIANITFRFRSGPSLKVESLRSFPVQNLVLILNWRDQDKVHYSLPWLEAALAKPDLRNVAIVALGSEQCHNKWVLPYLNATKVRFLFVVYDWNRVDNDRILQWPLGLATYRHFPANDLSSLDIQEERRPRPYLCNFIATVYPNSSRAELADFFESNPEFARVCRIKTRSEWAPHESDQSMADYVQALKMSELTLSPVGLNHECYRILEAVEYGSVPVVELDESRLRKTSCDQRRSLRLFRDLSAPFIYVHNWTLELPSVLRAQRDKSLSEKTKQRVQLIKWYHRFKLDIKKRFVNSIQNKFI